MDYIIDNWQMISELLQLVVLAIGLVFAFLAGRAYLHLVDQLFDLLRILVIKTPTKLDDALLDFGEDLYDEITGTDDTEEEATGEA